MSDQTFTLPDRERGMEALESFAAAGPAPTTQLPAVITTAPPPMLVHGSQKIEGAMREVRKVFDEVDAIAAMMGDDIFYSIPFKDRKKGTTTYVEGISIDGAMMVHQAFGNAAVHCWITAEGIDYWDIMALWQDLERGTEVSRPFRQRKSASRMGGGDSQRNQEAALQIGISKAERNVIANALKLLCNRAYRVAKNNLAEKIGKDIPGWQKKLTDRLADNRIPLDRVEAVIGQPVKDWVVLDMVKVVQLAKSVTDGEARLNEVFPPLGGEEPDERERMNAQLDQIASGPTDPVHSGGGAQEAATGGITAPQPTPVAVREQYVQMVTDLLQTATAHDRDEDYKLGQLEQARGWWEDQLPLDWHKKIGPAIANAAKVARGQLSKEDARKYLLAL